MKNLAVIIPIKQFSIFSERMLKCLTHQELKETRKILVFNGKFGLNDEKQVKEKLNNLTNTECIFVRNGNAGNARNIGIEIASDSEIMNVVFWDADDTVDVPSFRKIYYEHLSSKADITISRFEMINLINGKKKLSNNIRNIETGKFYSEGIGIWRMIFQRNNLNQEIFAPCNMGEDYVAFGSLDFTKLKINYELGHYYSYIVGRADQLTSSKTNVVDLLVSVDTIIRRYGEIHFGKENVFCLSRLLLSVFSNLSIHNIWSANRNILFSKLKSKDKFRIYTGMLYLLYLRRFQNNEK